MTSALPDDRSVGDMLDALTETGRPAMIIGGLAVNALGQSRATRDVDATILASPEEAPQLLETFKHHGYRSRVSDPTRLAREARILLLEHETTGVPADVTLAVLPFEEEALTARKLVKFEGRSLPLPRPEDLIVMKAVAHRPLDMSDIEALVRIHGDAIDFGRVRRIVVEFARTLESPEIAQDLDRILAAAGR